MRQKPGSKRSHGEKVVKDIRRATRKQYSAEEKIRIVLDGLKGEDSIAELCRALCQILLVAFGTRLSARHRRSGFPQKRARFQA